MSLIFINNIVGLSIEKTNKPILNTSIVMDCFEKNPNTRNIYIQVEPEAIKPLENQIIAYSKEYDYILTFNDNILKQCSNAYKYIFGMTRITPKHVDEIDINNKQYVVTSVTSDKLMTKGHYFRHLVYYNQLQIENIPTRFYISCDSKNLPVINNNPILGLCPLKIDLFKDAQFSLVMENSRQINYFTEKLCDCLITKTIPVYYGCPNISEYFDTTGWIILDNESMEDLISKIEILDPEYYIKHIDTVEKNFETVKQYIDIQENINRGLRSIPDY